MLSQLVGWHPACNYMHNEVHKNCCLQTVAEKRNQNKSVEFTTGGKNKNQLFYDSAAHSQSGLHTMSQQHLNCFVMCYSTQGKTDGTMRERLQWPYFFEAYPYGGTHKTEI